MSYHKSNIVNLKSKKGYTIIELLAVASILVILSGVIVGIIVSTLRGTSTTRQSIDVSQGGVYITSIIQGIISDSRNVTQIDDVDIDDCTLAPTGSESITLRRIDGRKTRLSCEVIGGVYTVASNGASLIDTNSVKTSSCSFACSQLVSDPYSIPIVSVSFKLVGISQDISSSGFTASATSSLRMYSP